MKDATKWSAHSGAYYRLATASVVAIAVIPWIDANKSRIAIAEYGQPIERGASLLDLMRHSRVEVYAIKSGMESFAGYAEGDHKARLLACFISEFGGKTQ